MKTTHLTHPTRTLPEAPWPTAKTVPVTLCNRLVTTNPYVYAIPADWHPTPPIKLPTRGATCKRCLAALVKGVTYLGPGGTTLLKWTPPAAG